MMVISIDKAIYLKEYKIEFIFSDNSRKIIDFENFLNRAKNPMIVKYRDLDIFKNFSIEYGDIIWNDFELCFPVWDLHEGKL